MLELQRTLEWYRDRRGCFSGSRVYELLGKGRSKDEPFSLTALAYIYGILGERLLSDGFVNNDEEYYEYLLQTQRTTSEMQWGTDYEGPAKLAYMQATGHKLHESSFTMHSTIPRFGASPDGVIVEDFRIIGGVEVKCPQLKNFARYCAEVRDNETLLKVSPQYYYQIQAEIMVTGAKWWDFVVYHPHAKRKLHIVGILPDLEAQALIAERVTAADKYVENMFDEIMGIA